MEEEEKERASGIRIPLNKPLHNRSRCRHRRRCQALSQHPRGNSDPIIPTRSLFLLPSVSSRHTLLPLSRAEIFGAAVGVRYPARLHRRVNEMLRNYEAAMRTGRIHGSRRSKMAALMEEIGKSLRRKRRRRLQIHLREVAVVEQALHQVYLLVDG